MNFNDLTVQRFIHQCMVARIATTSRSGRPSITPLYFVLVGDHLWLGTADWTLAAREARSTPRVSVLLQIEHTSKDHRILRITGNAVVRTDMQTVQVSQRRTAFRYVLSPGGIINQVRHLQLLRAVHRYRAQSAAKGTACVIDVTPERLEFLDVPRRVTGL